jgi:5'-nucleotidase
MPTASDDQALPPVTPDGHASQAAGANNLFQPLPEVEPPAATPGEPVVMTFRQPGAAPAAPASAPQPMLAAAPVGMSGNAYIVQKSDTLWSISQRFYGSGQRWRDIASANGIRDEKKLAVGQRIVLP